MNVFPHYITNLRYRVCVVTIVSATLIAGLIAFEFLEYQKISWNPEIIVDNSRKERMTINFDISFLKVPCFALTLDVMDSADQYQNNLTSNISKKQLGPRGQDLGEYKERELSRPEGYCGNCYKAAAKTPDGKPICCNSCSAVFAAYEHRSLPPPEMESIEQCNEEKWPEKIKQHASEGCRISGQFPVNKVAGNFHFAPGHSYDSYNYHLHDIRFLEGLHLDFSHKIHYLSFGDHHEHIANPLDNTENTGNGPERSFKYYTKVVATDFRYRNGHVLHTNQYAVTKNENETRGDKAAFPSVFFNYDISPMIVVYTEFKKSFTAFLVELCAIVGGVYTVAAIIDAIAFHAERKLREKTLMGKTN